MDAPLPQSLAERLRSETKALHTRAERTPTMQHLLRGEMSRRAYCALLLNLLAVYAVLEPALQRHAAHPMLAPVFEPALQRVASLHADLTALGQSDMALTTALVPATLRYVRRLHELDETTPQLLVAHAYVRYLGDLNGGQTLKRIVCRNAWMAPGEAVAFYDFGSTAATAALAQGFRGGLAAIAFDLRGTDAMVAEAQESFALHIEMFDQLDANEQSMNA
jgi:heme oxygenase (biliverdin-producing, ferredoxin)